MGSGALFHDNPHTTDTADTLLGTRARRTHGWPELVQLARDGELEMEDLTGMRVYTLTADADMRDLIKRFIEACDDRQFRVKAIYHVIRNLR